MPATRTRPARRPALAPSTLARVPDAELEAMRHALIREGDRIARSGGTGAGSPAALRRVQADLRTLADEQAARYYRRNP